MRGQSREEPTSLTHPPARPPSVQVGLAQAPLRDEILVQLMRQLTRNPRRESAARCSALLHLTLSAFSPSEALENFVEAFLRRLPAPPPPGGFSGDALLLALHKRAFLGPRQAPPDAAEVRRCASPAPAFHFVACLCCCAGRRAAAGPASSCGAAGSVAVAARGRDGHCRWRWWQRRRVSYLPGGAGAAGAAAVAQHEPAVRVALTPAIPTQSCAAEERDSDAEALRPGAELLPVLLALGLLRLVTPVVA